MDAAVLIDAVVRQTTVLIAQLATSVGMPPPLDAEIRVIAYGGRR